MIFEPPDWIKDENPLPPPAEVALGLFLHHSSRRIPRDLAIALAAREIVELFPELTHLQARLLLEKLTSAIAEPVS